MREPLRLPSDAPFAFCETLHAGPASPWHLRRLTSVGPKFGGGADSPALCGRRVAWDLDVNITRHHLRHACTVCVDEYVNRETPNAGTGGET